MAFLIKMVVNGGVDGNEFLQTSHLSEAEHGPLSSSKRKVRVLGSVVQPAAGILTPTYVASLNIASMIGRRLRSYCPIFKIRLYRALPSDEF